MKNDRENNEIDQARADQLCKEIAKNVLYAGKPVVRKVRLVEHEVNNSSFRLEMTYAGDAEENYFYYVDSYNKISKKKDESGLLLIPCSADAGGYQIAGYEESPHEMSIGISQEPLHVIKEEGKDALIELCTMHGIRCYEVTLRELAVI